MLLFRADIDECVDVDCNNRGLCKDGINAYTCMCMEGYEGKDCGQSTNSITIM